MTDNIHPETKAYRLDLAVFAADLLAATAEAHATPGNQGTEVHALLAQAGEKFIAEDLAEAIAFQAVAFFIRLAHPDATPNDVAQTLRVNAHAVAHYAAQNEGTGDD